jgi:small-conductance mechanosensitive channel
MIASRLNQSIISAVAITVGGIILFYLLFFLVKKWGQTKRHSFPYLLHKHLHIPGALLFVLITLNIDLGVFRKYINTQSFGYIRHGLELLLIASVSFFLLRLSAFITEFLISIYSRREYHDYTLRSVKTKYQLIQRVINILIILISVAAIGMTFDEIKKFGSAILASAGIAGIILGFAAQKSLGSLFAGIQLAISQPVKIDDTVVVEDQFGTVGEITLTYVVVNTWDGKRLIVPISYFLENSFQNWTRESAEVVGQVKIYVDYTLPVAELRTEFQKWIDASPLWDHRKSSLLVTNSDDKTMEVRITMSAKNADDAFDLQCEMREKLITFIQGKYPNSLPASRVNIQNSDSNKYST